MTNVRAILYRGPSTLNGEPIVVALYTTSGNRKVGNAPSVAILPDAPTYREAFKAAPSVCGGCPFLGGVHATRKKRTQGGCYSWALAMPIAAQLKAIAAGRYVEGEAAWLMVSAYMDAYMPMIVRVGTVGDSAAVPRHVWDRFRDLLPDRTEVQNYTHQWRRADAQHLRDWTMASVESTADASRAHAMGWRTFRAVLPDTTPEADERVCSYEADRVTCQACRACNGRGEVDNRPSITATIHGNTATANRARRVVAAAITRALKRATA